MKKNIVAPIALLASISLLTSCAEKTPVVPLTPPTETTAPVDTPTTLETPVPTTPEVTPTTQTETPVESKTLSRTETVAYTNPSGRDQVEFSVTITDGVITAASAVPKAENDISLKKQEAFAAEVSGKVVGMKSADFDVDAVGGASLTTAAFETFVRSF
jgi:uncharacterized protein with FMN-binding domain